MHGRGGEERKRSRHMCSVPPAAAVTLIDVASTDSSTATAASAADSFSKDGRKISIGDCALFQSGNSPPFIGIIRSLTSSKECSLSLSVNWLYRPADIKLSKGISLEAAPNEVFYSFHKDEISVASLLHPCKVTFLRKGVELPPGISSFVCRRVYDIQNKCLWWLTDKDYINERQEEVDQLLDRTRLEMHAALQSGARSPKPLNVSTSTQQSKPSSDTLQNTSTSFPSQVKGKKRERGDQVLEPIKRERPSKTDDGDSGSCRLESITKAEIAKITEKGGLINLDGVDTLVHFMLLDRADKKIDWAGRIMLSDVIAATDNPECLDRFVQLMGVPVLDDWLQEAHKGRIGDINNLGRLDSNSPKENDKCIEEFLHALLRALDRLPVNLYALQTSNIGKSVNNLRSHRSLEIQKKARTLVDTWKKRVNMEMKINDAKSASNQFVSWPGKPSFTEASHVGNRRAGSSEGAIKSIITQPPGSKSSAVRLGNVDMVAKSSLNFPGTAKLMPISPVSALESKDPHCKMASGNGTSDIPLTLIREEKSSSSSQSLNNSQSCSSDYAKNACKEDARSSTAGSMHANTSGRSSRTRKSSSGFLGSVQKETVLGKVSQSRNIALDKIAQVGPNCERLVDNPADYGNSPRLIVRLPNPGRSPARSVSGGSFDDPSALASRASSPGVSDKHDRSDWKAKGKRDSYRSNVPATVNTESWQSNDVKNGLCGSDEGERSPAAVSDEKQIRNNVENEKLNGIPKITCSSLGNGKSELPESEKSHAAAFSMTALVESCVKYSEASSSLSVDDGMNLLASVATGEITKSEPVSPCVSPEMNSSVQEDTSINKCVEFKSPHDDALVDGHVQLDENSDSDPQKLVKCPGSLPDKEVLKTNTSEICNLSSENKSMLPLLEHKAASEHGEEIPHSSMKLKETADLCSQHDGDCDRTAADGGVMSTAIKAIETPFIDPKEETPEVEGARQLCERSSLCIPSEKSDLSRLNESLEDAQKVVNEKVVGAHLVGSDYAHSLSDQNDTDQISAACLQVERDAVKEPSSCLMDDKKMEVKVETCGGNATTKRLPSIVTDHCEALGRSDSVVASCDFASQGNTEQSKLENSMDSKVKMNQSDVGRFNQTVLEMSNANVSDEKSDRKEVLEHFPCSPSPDYEFPVIPAQEADQCRKSMGSKLSGVEADEKEECVSTAEVSSLSNASGSDMTTKLDFDLNEGFPADEGTQINPEITIAPGCKSVVQLSSQMLYTVSPLSSSLPASITVAAPAKGPFVHPENLLRCKGELGWKGSAATSAFRPAEPRKVLEIPLSASDIISCYATTEKRVRPPIDIDLNVTDERVLEDMPNQCSAHESGIGTRIAVNSHGLGCKAAFSSTARNAVGLDLDLNRMDDDSETGQTSVSWARKYELTPGRSWSSDGFSNGEANILRDFDLNNGPGDESGVEIAQRNLVNKSSGLSSSQAVGIRVNTDLGSLSSWFPPVSSYSAVTIPSLSQDRGDQAYPFVLNTGTQRILGSAGGTFGAELYRGPVLSSSAMAYSPAAYPFNNGFSLASASFSGGSTAFVDSSGGVPCFPAVPSQLLGPTVAVSSHDSRAQVISLPESSAAAGAEISRKWGRHSLDLNSGPGSTDLIARDERMTTIAAHLSIANPQPIAEEHARIYHSTGAPLKRQEPEGGWEAISYKQSSWQ